jgi:HAD superfamily hydrolase (TIGR01509 family)
MTRSIITERAKRIKAVLFDLDGTLADTEQSWLSAKAVVARRHGISWTHEDGLASIGQPTEVYSTEFVRRGASAGMQTVAAEITSEVASAMAAGVPWRPGALEILRQAVDGGLQTGLVTMAFRPVAEAIARASSLPVFDVTVAGDEVTHSKPHPEPYLTALAALKLEPGQAIAVEDTTTGATSAETAGLRTIVIPSMVAVPPSARRVILPTLQNLCLEELLAAI